MAAGAVTNVALDQHTSQVVPVVIGDLKMTVSTVPGNTSYATGGDALTAAQLGLGTLQYAFVVQVAGSAANSTGAIGIFNNSTGKLQSFVAAGTEVTSTTNISGNTYTILALGY